MRPRLFLQVLSLEARTRMSYRVDFWLNAIVGFLVEFGVIWFLWTAMFQESGREVIGGYTRKGMAVYYLAVILLGKLVRTNRFEGAVSNEIYEGGLNRYLLFPVPYFPFKYAQHLGNLGPAVLQFLLFGTVTFLWLDVPASQAPTLAGTGMALVCVLFANLLYFLLDYVIQLVAFWADNVWSLDVGKWFLASLLGGYMVPLTLFPDGVRAVLRLLPFRFFFDFPARVLLGRVSPAAWAGGLALAAGWCILLAMLARGVWRRGRLRYTGVGI